MRNRHALRHLVDHGDNSRSTNMRARTTAEEHGYSATFMPKPLFGDNGSGMHVHQSLWKDGNPLFFDANGYALLSDTARWYIGGTPQACCCFVGDLCAYHQQLPPLGARLRSPDQLGLLGTQPLSGSPYPHLFELTQSAPRRSTLPRPDHQPLLRPLLP
jgi:hypothetical protein